MGRSKALDTKHFVARREAEGGHDAPQTNNCMLGLEFSMLVMGDFVKGIAKQL